MSTAILKIPQTQAPAGTDQTTEPREVKPQQESFSAEELPRKRPISAHDCIRMAEIGLFEGQRVELIAGEVIIMPPITEPHSRSVARTSTQLILPLREQYMIRSQNSFDAGERGYPEPDIAVVRLDQLDKNPDLIPSQAALIIEISRSTLRDAQTTKSSLIEQQVEVYRQPIPSATAQFGADYASRQIHRPGESVNLLEVPEVAIEVNAILP